MKFRLFLITAILAVIFMSCDNLPIADNKVNDEIDSVSYALGVAIGTNLQEQFDEIDPDIMAQALEDIYNGEEKYFTADEANLYLQSYAGKQMQRKGDENILKGKEFLESNSTEEGVITTESGLQYKILEEGVGESPIETDKVKVHYRGTLIDGTEFDSSYKRGQPATFAANRVIPGWTEALTMMKQGSKWMLYIPSELGYGERGAGQMIGSNEVLIFEVELLEIVK
ncbi:FKBP-type peptidyl-prolyl cis-trans isomerase [Bacteroidota bacterium]